MSSEPKITTSNAFFEKELTVKELELQKLEEMEQGWLAKFLLKPKENNKILKIRYGTEAAYIAFKQKKVKQIKRNCLDLKIKVEKDGIGNFTLTESSDGKTIKKTETYVVVGEHDINLEKYLLNDDGTQTQNIKILVDQIRQMVQSDLKNTKEYQSILNHVKGPGKKRSEAIWKSYEDKMKKELMLSTSVLVDCYTEMLLMSKLCPNYKFFKTPVFELDFLTEFRLEGNALKQVFPNYLELSELNPSSLNFLETTLPKLINVEKAKIEMDLEEGYQKRLEQIPLTSYVGPSAALEIFTNASELIMELQNRTIAGLYKNGLKIEKMKDCVELIKQDNGEFIIVSIEPLDGTYSFITFDIDGKFEEIIDEELKQELKKEYLKYRTVARND